MQTSIEELLTLPMRVHFRGQGDETGRIGHRPVIRDCLCSLRRQGRRQWRPCPPRRASSLAWARRLGRPSGPGLGRLGGIRWSTPVGRRGARRRTVCAGPRAAVSRGSPVRSAHRNDALSPMPVQRGRWSWRPPGRALRHRVPEPVRESGAQSKASERRHSPQPSTRLTA
jgi:hypothetical protein